MKLSELEAKLQESRESDAADDSNMMIGDVCISDTGDLEEKLRESRELGATDDSNVITGKTGDLLIDLDPDEEKGYEREYSIEV